MLLNKKRLPPWFKVKVAGGGNYAEVSDIVRQEGLNTVCKSARCPNVWECWSRRTATFMILGNVCTRNCRFCAVETGSPGGTTDTGEPSRVAAAIAKLGVRHAVITSVTRDDLADGGASVFAAVIGEVRKAAPDCTIEVLIPDFLEHLDIVLAGAPDILNHNLETVPGLYAKVRPQAVYERSVALLARAAMHGAAAKTGLMAGLGETNDELYRTFDDIAAAGVSILSIGQYLQPTRLHLPVEKFYTPEEFDRLKEKAHSAGIKHVESAPLVRSSYHAEKYGL